MARSDRAWREPTRSLPLRWGTYAGRYLAGLVLIIGGAVHVQGSNTYTLGFLLSGTIAGLAGWSIMPAHGWRRLAVVVPATFTTWILVAGPSWVWLLVIPYLSWLLVRHRPIRAYITVLFPIANGLIVPQLLSEYEGMPLAIVISMAVFIASAWLARVIAASARVSSVPAGSVG